MPQERGYERQTGVAQPVGLPGASAAAFGAGVGGAIADLGQTMHRDEVRSYQLDRQQKADSEAAAFNATFAKLREQADKASVDARNNAAPGGAGHAQAMRDWWDKQAQGLTAGITEDRVRRSAEAQLQEFGSRLGASEYQWQEGKRVAKLVTDQGVLRDVAANRARRLPDPKAFAEELSIGRQGIEALEGVPADVRAGLIRDLEETSTVGFFNGMIERDPASVTRVLDTGAFDGMLSAEQMERLRKGADIQVRSNDAAARAQAAHELTIAKEALATERARLDTGAGTPQDWGALADRYDKIGDTSSAVTARAKGASAAAVIGFRGETLPQLDTRIATLQAKKNGGGLSAAEASTLTGLQDLRGQVNGMLGQPGGALAAYQFATGRPIAPIDPGDPASLQARAVQAKAAAATYGRVVAEPILATELPVFKDMMASGANGKLQALAAIQGFGDPQVIRAAGAQIAGDDGTFRIAAQLPLSVARDVLRGADALKTNPKVLQRPANQPGPSEHFRVWYGGMLSAIGGSYRDDVFQAARAYYAARAVDGGEDDYNPKLFDEAIKAVLGQVRRADGSVTGGIARTAGGIVLVPQGMAPNALLQRFAQATAADYARASGNHKPVWSDRSGMTRGEFSKLVPTARGDGRYGFRGPGGHFVHDERGMDYTIDIGALKR